MSLTSVPDENEQKLKELDVIVGRFSDSPHTEHQLPSEASGLWTKNDGDDGTNSLSKISQHYAPLHLTKQFEELYRVLHPALVDRKDKKNASAFLQGARGSGKSLVLERVLSALQAEIQSTPKEQQQRRPFRIVRLNGILVPGSQVALCVQEILRQLTEMAYQENLAIVESTNDPDEAPQEAPLRKKRRKSERTKLLLRLRRTCFTNQIQLLNEILQFACLDGIPILFILDELDAFVKSTGGETLTTTSGDAVDRQLLLYHLLDRVATDSSLVSFVGITCHNGTMSLLEKRIRSRAEGTTRFIYFGPCASWQDWVEIVGKQLQTDDGESSRNLVHDEWMSLVTLNPNEVIQRERQQVLDCLRRSFNLGYSVRWLFRVLSTALLLYRHDLKYGSGPTDGGGITAKVGSSSFQSCLMQSLASNSGPFLTASGEKDLILVDNLAVNDRIQALRDLSGPQLAIVLASRRILVRDSHRENTVPLTFDRIMEEYKSYKGNSNRYSRRILWVSFRDLLDSGLIRPGTDHSGTVPLQYNMDDSFLDLSAPTVGKIPLHLNLDIHRELQKAIDQKLLDCSAALQEWGKKTT